MAPSQAKSDSRTQIPKSQPNANANASPDDIGRHSLQFGAGAGAIGLFVGTALGTTQGSKTPVLYTLATGLRWLGQGTVFYGTRQMYLARYGPLEKATPAQKLEASTLAAAISQAAFSGLTLAPIKILRGAFLGSLCGAGGQLIVNSWTSSSKDTAKKSGGGWLDSKWSPLKRLTDREHEHILEEKILKIDAEIALIDDNIAALRTQKEEQLKAAAKAASQKPSGTVQA